MRWEIPRIPAKRGHEKQIQLLNFLIRLNIFAIPLYVILIFDLSLPGLQKLIADFTYYLLALAEMNPTINDLFISIPIKDGTWGAFINWDCTGWKSMLAFFALVAAVDRKSNVKLKGLAIFIPLIFIINIIRIFFMFFYVRTFDLAYFEIVHAAVCSWGLIIVVLVFWVIWMNRFWKIDTKAKKKTQF